jgi:hypothetical protein
VSTNLKDLFEIISDLSEGISKHVKDLSSVKVEFKTFDSYFDEHTDEYQRPTDITSIDVDMLNWNRVTITIEDEKKD